MWNKNEVGNTNPSVLLDSADTKLLCQIATKFLSSPLNSCLWLAELWRLEEVHSLISGTSECVTTLHGKGTLQMWLRILRQEDHSGLSRWAQSHNTVLTSDGAMRREAEGGMRWAKEYRGLWKLKRQGPDQGPDAPMELPKGTQPWDGLIFKLSSDLQLFVIYAIKFMANCFNRSRKLKPCIYLMNTEYTLQTSAALRTIFQVVLF